MENRNQLRDVSIMDVMRDIESTEKTDYITDLNKDLYLGYESAVRSAAALRIDDPEIYARVIGRHLNLREAETKAVAQRLIETGDRTLFGVQAALTDAAKYAETYDRKLELERCGGKIFTELPSRWSAIQKLAESEKLDN